MSNQITAAILKIISFVNYPQSLAPTTTDSIIQQQIDPTEQRVAVKLEQIHLNTEQSRIEQEIEHCQSNYQKISDSLDALLTERENIEDKVEALCMQLYCYAYEIPDAIEEGVFLENYQDSKEMYKQLCHHKCKLERRLTEIDQEIEKFDIDKSGVSEKKEILQEEQVAVDRRKESLYSSLC